MNRLEYYARRTAQTKGFEHSATLNALRVYIKQTDPRIIAEEVSNLKKFSELRAVWEAGLPPDLQEAVLKRHEKLTLKRR